MANLDPNIEESWSVIDLIYDDDAEHLVGTTEGAPNFYKY